MSTEIVRAPQITALSQRVKDVEGYGDTVAVPDDQVRTALDLGKVGKADEHVKVQPASVQRVLF